MPPGGQEVVKQGVQVDLGPGPKKEIGNNHIRTFLGSYYPILYHLGRVCQGPEPKSPVFALWIDKPP